MLSQTPHPKAPEADTSPDSMTRDGSAESGMTTPNGDGDEEEQYEPDTTYFAIRGIHPSDLDDADRELLEKRVATFLLTSGYPIEDVAVANEQHAIVEIRQ